MKSDLVSKIELLGFSQRAAQMYLTTLKLGGGVMQDIAKHSKVPRTSLYYTLEELLSAGALVESRLGKRNYYQAVPPRQLIAISKDRLSEAEESLPDLELEAGRGKSSSVEILHGPQGFKVAWEGLLQAKDKEFRIITSGESFLDYVREKYVIKTIIGRKKMLKVKSYQLIPDTAYAREIVSKDNQENRQSRFLPASVQLPYTIVFSKEKVLMISSRSENVVTVWNSPKLSMTMRSMFEELWRNSES
ncbi:hypothetical protein IPM19_00120 [bacterium]|nr:MAG: hypothetical protein IPM19_00120 [bacterium]